MGRKELGGIEIWRSHLQTIYGLERFALLEQALKQTPQLFCRIANKDAPSTDDESIFLPPYTYIATSSYDQNNTDYFLDPASVFPVAALDVHPDHTVLDMCAAPGGKSLLIASQLFAGTTQIGHVQLVANELSAARLGRLQRTIKQHYPNDHGKIQVVSSDPTRSLTVTGRYGPYDRILIDAPCSSDQHKVVSNALAEWRIAIPKRCAETQLKLLLGGCEMLKSGGRLVYSTCALSDLENHEVVSKALSKSDKFIVETHEKVEELLQAKILQSPHAKLGIESQSQEHGPNIVMERRPLGHIILPDKASGSGPIYFAVIVKKPR